MENEIFSGTVLVLALLSVAVLSSVALKRLHFPYTIGLVVVGGVLGFLAWNVDGLSMLRGLELSPQIILYLILPTLIFEAALNIDTRMLLKNIVPIFILAAVGLLISAAVITASLVWLSPLPLAAALLFGALISATDPVAVIALFKDVGAPKRLVTLIDGESIFNDATAIVLFTILMGALTAGIGPGTDVSGLALKGAINFIVVLAGGLAVGAAVGWVGSYLFLIDRGSYVFQISLSLILAYASFLLADHVFHFSGVMSALAAGLVIRHRAEAVMKRPDIHSMEHFWEYFSFIANSFVFLLLGMSEVSLILHKGSIMDSLYVVLISIPILMVARAASIWLLVPPYNWVRRWLKRETIPQSYQAILFWGGLRGAVPVALVLVIPHDFPARDTVVHMTMAYILFTLLVQGTTIKKFMDMLGLKPDTSDFGDREVKQTRYPFPADSLASLVMERVKATFDAEGFFMRERGRADNPAYFMKRGKQQIFIERQASELVLTTEPKDVGYANTVLYESLLDLNESVASIKQVIKPEGLALEAQSNVVSGVDPAILRHIKPARIKSRLLSRTKEQVIEELVDIIVDSGATSSRERLLRDVQDREATMSTGLGKGIAIPHAKTETVQSIEIAIGICRDGIDYKSLDGLPARIFILILGPKTDDSPHLGILSNLGKLVSNQAVREAILEAESGDEVYHILRNAVSRRNRER